MKNLIMADLKVMGHRLWSVPLVALVLVVLVSVIPGVEMPEPVRNFMIAFLSPCLLIFELFREEQKHGTDSLMLTMPVNKNTYVLSKFTTVIILGITAIPAGWLAALLTNVIQGGDFSLAESFSFLSGMFKIMAFVIPAVYFIFPIYFFFRKSVVSAVIGIIIVFFITERMLTFFYEYFYVSFFEDNLYLIFYFTGMILIPTALIHLIIKLWFRSVPGDVLKTVWFILIFILFLFTLETLMINLHFTDYYFLLTGIVDGSDGEKKEKILHLIANYRLYIAVISILLITISSALFYIRRKSSQLFWQNAILYLFAPLVIMLITDKYAIFISILLSSNKEYYVTEETTVITALVLLSVVSFKASIYLLNNNRTLK